MELNTKKEIVEYLEKRIITLNRIIAEYMKQYNVKHKDVLLDMAYDFKHKRQAIMSVLLDIK